MAVAVTVVASVNSDTYDAVSAQAMPGGELPEGCKLHVAGPFEGKWRVLTVWDDAEQFHRFRSQTLLPALQAAGAIDEGPPDISIDPVHRLIS